MTEYRTIGRRLQRVQALAELPDLTGRVTMVTGGTDGVGRALAEQLARSGAVTLLTARDAAKGKRVANEIKSATRNEGVHVVGLDLADLSSVREAAADTLRRFDRLDLLVANAGYQEAGGGRVETAQGFEMTFGVNHLGHALLIGLLEEQLKASAPSRVVIVASEAHRRSRGGLDFDDLMMTRGKFQGGLAYARSKLANILYARELSNSLSGTNVTVHAAHPGGVDTPMMRQHFRGPVMHSLYLALRTAQLITPEDAAAGLLRVATDPELVAPSGQYFECGIHKRPKPMAEDDDAARRLWSITQDLLVNAE
jgi:NAD(P)-dependent dehydrogenase (short-subunit alcohol dehydrogenase family)